MRKAVILFFLTFAIVVLAGVSFLFIREYHSSRSGAQVEKNAAIKEVQKNGTEAKETKRPNERVPAGDSNAKGSLVEETLPSGDAGKTGDALTDNDKETNKNSGEDEAEADEDDTPIDPYADVPEDRYTRRAATAQPDTVRIGFAGDILFDRSYAIQAQMESRGGGIEGAVGASLLKEMRDVDIMVANNEFPYTDGGAPQEGKAFTFHAAVKNVRQMSEMGVDLAGIANNHVFDYGETGFLDTLDTLDRAGIARMGAGRDIEEASHPMYYIAGGMKIAFIAATQIERHDNPNTRGATDSLPGVFRCMDETRLLKVVGEAKKESDYVIVFIHWGTENELGPDWLQTRQAPELAEAGADLVIGMHSHCLQPITYEGNVPVFYSLGNFLFNSKTLDTCLVEAELTRSDETGRNAGAKLSSLRFIPCIQSGCTVRMADDTESARILEFMRGVSSGVGIDEDGYITEGSR